MEKSQQFLLEEQEVLADFLLDMEGAEGNKEYARAAALWSMQSARVGAIRDALMLLSQPVDEEPVEHYCNECGAVTLYLESQIMNAPVEEKTVECEKCGFIERL